MWDSGAVRSDRPALRRCASVPPDEFASDYWDRQPLLSRSADLPGGFDDLLTLADVDELLSRRGLRTPFIRLANEGRILDSNRYTGPGGIGAKVRDQVLDERVLTAFADGATIVLQGLHRLWPPLIDFTARLVADLGHPVQINAYITPPQSQGFADHYDTHDVFVIAVAGRKRWRIRPPIIERPAADDPWTDHADEVRAAAAQPPIIDTVLEPGDVLYLPRGYLHAATAEGGVCAHLTVGIHPITRRSIAELLLADIDREPTLRTALPLRAIDDDTATAAMVGDVSDVLRRRIDELASAPDTAAVARALVRSLTTDARPEPLHPIAQSVAAAQLAADDVIRLRRGLRLFVDKSASGELTLEAGVARVPVASDAGPAIANLASGAPHRVDDLPGLSADESIALAVTLLRAGVVVPVRE